jgi:hypothetical protein
MSAPEKDQGDGTEIWSSWLLYRKLKLASASDKVFA